MTFSELYVGQKASIQKTFADADLRAFAEVSLDTNPIHLDEEYAKTTIFGKRIVHGILTSGLISAENRSRYPYIGTYLCSSRKQAPRSRHHLSWSGAQIYRSRIPWRYHYRRV